MKPLFAHKSTDKANIALNKKDEIVQSNKKVAETLNGFSENAVSSLTLNENSFVINDKDKKIQDPIEKIIEKYQN